MMFAMRSCREWKYILFRDISIKFCHKLRAHFVDTLRYSKFISIQFRSSDARKVESEQKKYVRFFARLTIGSQFKFNW